MSAFCSQTCVQPPCHPSLAAPSCGDLTVSTWYDSHLNLYEVEVGLDDAGGVARVVAMLLVGRALGRTLELVGTTAAVVAFAVRSEAARVVFAACGRRRRRLKRLRR